MMHFLLLLWMVGDGPQFQGTEIYAPLKPNQVAVSPQGRVFILDGDESRVVYFDADGKRLGTFGQPGEGPGDLNKPYELQLQGDKVYVIGFNTVSIWSVDAVFQVGHKTPFGVRMFKADQGFLGVEHDFMGQDPSRVFRYSQDFKEKQELVHYQGPMSGRGGFGSGKFYYNPAKSSESVYFGPGGRTLFKKEKTGYHIRVLDGKTGAEIGVIKKEVEPVPFDRLWGMAEMEEAKTQMRDLPGGDKMEYVADFPDYFPAIGAVRTTPDGLLAVSPFKLPRGKELPLDFYDEKGQPAKSPFKTLKALERFLAMHQGRVYIATYEDDEAGIAVMAPEAAQSYIDAHPIDFDQMAALKAKLRSFQ